MKIRCETPLSYAVTVIAQTQWDTFIQMVSKELVLFHNVLQNN